MKGDSAASGHYIRQQDAACLNSIHPYQGPSVTLPDADTINPTHQGDLPLKGLSPPGRKGTILPDLKSASLISLGQLCDDGCKVLC